MWHEGSNRKLGGVKGGWRRLEIIDELIEQAKIELTKARTTWLDLPLYVYSADYEKALLEWISKHIENGRTDISTLILYCLHHEVGDKMPYFPFNREGGS
jgi:hypothetical protein